MIQNSISVKHNAHLAEKTSYSFAENHKNWQKICYNDGI
jgi:hypothetical protein